MGLTWMGMGNLMLFGVGLLDTGNSIVQRPEQEGAGKGEL